MLMKKCFGLIALLSVISLCSCGEAKDITEVNTAVPENIQANLQENPYLDITDLTYDGTETQNIAIGYDFEDPADNDPVLTYNRYRSKDGEVFCFDMQGRLCKYEKTDLTEMEKAETASAQSTSAKPAKTREQLQQISQNVAESLLQEDLPLEVEGYGCGEYLVTNESTVKENESPFSAIVDLDNSGEVEQLSVSYNTLSVPIDYDYFEQKLEAYIAEAKQTWDILDYTVESRYQQIGNKVYAMYTVIFREAAEEPDGAYFCESVGFTQDVSDIAVEE